MTSKNRRLSTIAPASNTSFSVSTNSSFSGTLSAVDVNISGNLLITGTTTTVNTTTLDVKDLNITVAKGANSTTANSAGITVDGANAQLFYLSSDDSLNVNKVFKTTNTVTIGTGTYFVSNGNVGIGVSSPANKLDVDGSVSFGATINTGTGVSTGVASIELGINRSGSGVSYLDFHSTANSDFDARIIKWSGVNGDFEINNAGAGNIILSNNGSERLRIDSNGNVGIGTSTPTGKLSITNGDDARVKIFSNGGSVGVIDSVANGNEATGRWLSINPTGGNVGIGTSAPSAKLHVVSSTNSGLYVTDNTVGTAVYNSTGGVGTVGTLTNHPFTLWSNNSERVRIDASGNVGIGTGSAIGAKLHVAGLTAVADDSAVQDTTPYGSFGVTRSAAGAATRSYFAMTRAGTKVYAIGISSDSAFVIGEPNTSREISTERFRIGTGGSTTAWVDLRSPIFYDSSDTGYYIDPNSNSNMWQVTANDWFRAVGSKGLYSATHGNHIYATSSSFWTITGNGQGSGGLRLLQSYEDSIRGYLYWDGSGFGLLNNSGSWVLRSDYGANHELYNITYANDVRPYIIYDRNNTGYYLDPTGTSLIYNLTITNSFDVTSGGKRYLYREGRIDCVNTVNNAWENMILQGASVALRTQDGVDKFSLSGGVINLNNGSGARGGSGRVLTTPNDSVANAIRANGYIEWTTDVGAIGTNYFLSDIRKKDNVEPSTFSSTELIKKIEFIQFDWKPESGGQGHVDVGVSAQQLQEVDNRLVNELSDGSLMVYEPALIAHLAKAIQEQQKMIEELRAEIALLKNAK